jgi:O-antigen/teichoic acid export membrane protein
MVGALTGLRRTLGATIGRALYRPSPRRLTAVRIGRANPTRGVSVPPADPSAPSRSIAARESTGTDPLTVDSGSTASARHVRGSSLLLLGRVIATVVNFLVQVLIVRYLSTGAYGAFAYALSLVTFGETLVTLGVDRAVGRFLPIYQERGEWAKLFGTIALVGGTIVSLGLVLIVLVVGLAGTLGPAVVRDDLAVSLIVILVVLAPLQAADAMFANVLAVFASPRAIFVRRFVLSPLLRLTVVALLVIGRFDASFLAAGYVITGAIGVVIYSYLLYRVLSQQGLLAHLDVRRLDLPVREILLYTIPLLTTDLVFLFMNTTDAVLLGAFHGVDEVGAWRVVQPLGGLNQLVLGSFTLLFVPAASRLFARRANEEMRDLYWQTAIWMAVATFPIFVVTFALAEPLTVLLYEERYVSSGLLLSLLALGRYVDVVLGFNGLTLRVFGDMRAIVLVNVFAAATNLTLNLLLIPSLGALGAAIGTATTLILYNIAKQVALARVTAIPAFESRYLRVYLAIIVAAGSVFALQVLVAPPLPVGIAVAAISSLFVAVVSRDQLRMAQTFPELMRLPLARLLVGGAPGRPARTRDVPASGKPPDPSRRKDPPA